MKALGADFRYGYLRSLRADDVDGMLEWMHDADIASQFNFDFMNVTRDVAEAFIKDSVSDTESLNFAIAGDGDEYLGTVSLKHVDKSNLSAEYAISTRHCSHGTGAASKATKDVLDFAFNELGLHRVYLNVKATNSRAIRFYEKIGFVKEGESRDGLRLPDGEFVNLVWYSILNPSC